MSTVRRRGRPPGTDYKEDLEALALVADRLVADDTLTPWPAMRAVCRLRKWKGTTDEAILARWVRKWKSQGARQLEAALQRKTDRETRPAVVRIGALAMSGPMLSAEALAGLQRMQAEISAVARQIAAAMDTPGMRSFAEQHRKIVEQFASSPALKAMERISEQMREIPSVQIPKGLWGTGSH